MPVALAAVLAVFVMGQMPASAHGDKVRHGKDFATVAPDHLSGSVCDEEKDGHWVYAEWYFEDGTGATAYGQGADGPCTNVYFSNEAYAFRICEENKGYREEYT